MSNSGERYASPSGNGPAWWMLGSAGGGRLVLGDADAAALGRLDVAAQDVALLSTWDGVFRAADEGRRGSRRIVLRRVGDGAEVGAFRTGGLPGGAIALQPGIDGRLLVTRKVRYPPPPRHDHLRWRPIDLAWTVRGATG